MSASVGSIPSAPTFLVSRFSHVDFVPTGTRAHVPEALRRRERSKHHGEMSAPDRAPGEQCRLDIFTSGKHGPWTSPDSPWKLIFGNLRFLRVARASLYFCVLLCCCPYRLQAVGFPMIPSGSLCTNQPGWQENLIGSPLGMVGSDVTFSAGTFTVFGIGTQIFGNADDFSYTSTQLSGDGSIVARVDGLQGGSYSSVAGVAIREPLAGPSAPNASLTYSASNGAFSLDVRTTEGGTTTSIGTVNATLPYFVKLTRSGNAFSGYVSPDGVNWTLVGTQNIQMGWNAYAGLAATSGSDSTTATATFAFGLLAIPAHIEQCSGISSYI